MNRKSGAMKISKEFKIGIFVIVILAASFILINFLRGKDVFNREMTVVSYYENVAGLVPSASVSIKGYKAGTVQDVKYDPATGLFKVSCSVLKQFEVPEDSKMTIYSVDIMGGKGVRIDLGTSDTPAQDGAELEANFETDLVSSLSSGIVPLLDKVSSAVDSLETAVSSINVLLSGTDPESVSRTLLHLEKTMASVEGISSKINGESDELASFISNLEKISSKLSIMTDKADTTITHINSIALSLDESDLEGLVASFRSLAEKMQDPDGSMGKLLSDDSVYTSLDSLLTDVDSLVKKIEKNPKKYLKISVF